LADGDDPIPLDRETREVIRLLRDAAARAKKVILNPPGKTDKNKSWNASRAAQLLAGVNRELDQVKGKLANVASKKIAGAYRDGIDQAEQQARDAGVRPEGGALQGGFTVVDRRRALVLVNQTTEDLGKAVDSIKATTGKIVKQTQALGLNPADINRMLAGGTIEGKPKETLRELKGLVQKAAIEGKIVTVNTRTGVTMSFDPDYYAEMVFQTKLAETTNVATIQRLRDRKIFYVKIIGSNSRNFCTAFVGRAFYIGDGADPKYGFPHVRELPRGGPPFHPRCTKRYTAFSPALQGAEAIEKAKLKPNERELLGKDSNAAQNAFVQKPKKAQPQPPTTVDRQATVSAQAKDARRQLREIGIGFGERLAAIERTQADVAARMYAAAEAGQAELVDELTAKFSSGIDEIRGLEAQRRQSGLAIIRAENPIAVDSYIDGGIGAARRKTAEEGISEFARMVDRSLIDKVSVVARAPERKHVSSGRSYYLGGKIFMSSSAPVRVVVHEMGHLLEDASPDLHAAVLRFYDRRTEGESLQSLKKLTGLRYKPTERTRPDDFFDPYVGKDYGRIYSEVVSMAMESMWADPFDLAKRDPDFFEFMFKALRGVFE
jgi:hypothetical protein